jgi:glycosyltransferase involved in cell wall biosynthesis
MRDDRVADVVIPALDEEAAVGGVVRAIDDPRVRRVIVVDNGSVDATAAAAGAAGAVVVREPFRGYGAACLRGLACVAAEPPFAVAFMDADGADDPRELPKILDPIFAGRADLVIGSRTLGRAEPGALSPQARFGNRLAVFLVRRLYGITYTDLGPFRAVRYDGLERLEMSDRTYGWTVEMQVRAAKLGLRAMELPVRYRRRVGRSKVSGTVRGVIGAGTKILWTIGREACSKERHV